MEEMHHANCCLQLQLLIIQQLILTLFYKTDMHETIAISNNSNNVRIATRKGNRTCTKRPISKFVSYNFLSSSYRSCVSCLTWLFLIIGQKQWQVKMEKNYGDGMEVLEGQEYMETCVTPLWKDGAVGCQWVLSII